MRYLLAATLLALAPTAASAAVTITFTTPDGQGRIVIDTTRLGNLETDAFGSSTYSGENGVAFLTGSFVNTAGRELLLQSGSPAQFIQFDDSTATISVGFSDDAGGAPGAFSNLALTGTGTVVRSMDGVPLPDFTGASSSFTVDTQDGGPAGDVTRLTQTASTPGAVPEPATWAMMVAGFGLAASALRRRARITVAFG